MQIENTQNVKSKVIRNPWCVHNRLFNANFD
jgi:hypothetical protein